MKHGNKISFDFHGVINQAPDFFKSLADEARAQENLIYIVSGGPREYIKEYLSAHGFQYDVLWCIFDYFDAKEKIEVAADGSFHIDDEAWNAAKGKYCAVQDIAIHIDDSPIYGRYFTTPYARFDVLTKILHYGTQNVSILQSPADVWKKIQAWRR